MSICENCIHCKVCRYVSEPQESCSYRKTEDAARHTLRLIYMDFYSNAKRNRERAERYSRYGEADSATEIRRVSDIQASDASRVRFWCRKIDFDPSANG